MRKRVRKVETYWKGCTIAINGERSICRRGNNGAEGVDRMTMTREVGIFGLVFGERDQ